MGPGAEGSSSTADPPWITASGTAPLGYAFQHGRMRCNLLAFAVHLTDVREGEGRFLRHPRLAQIQLSVPAVDTTIRTRRRARLPTRRQRRRRRIHRGYHPRHPPLEGCQQHRNIIYRFSPATNAYGRGYAEGGWPASYIEGMTEAQRATMEMPYHPRLNRVAVAPDASGVTRPAPREKHKVDFDRAVFKSDYF